MTGTFPCNIEDLLPVWINEAFFTNIGNKGESSILSHIFDLTQTLCNLKLKCKLFMRKSFHMSQLALSHFYISMPYFGFSPIFVVIFSLSKSCDDHSWTSSFTNCCNVYKTFCESQLFKIFLQTVRVVFFRTFLVLSKELSNWKLKEKMYKTK